MEINIPVPAPRELVLIVDPKAGLRVREGEVSSIIEGVDVKPLADLLYSEQAVIRPLYGVSEERLKERTGDTKTLMGVDQPLDLSIFYKITAAERKLKRLAKKLRNLSIVQSAYIKPGAELPIINNSIKFLYGISPGIITADFTRFQVYLNAASEGGIDARCAWATNGGGGSGVNIIDVEGAWRFSHEDLMENQGGVVGTQISDIDWMNHGTAVLGVISGDRNNFGITGICPDAMVRAVSIFGNPNGSPAADWGIAAAIRLAADKLQKGDIILIEHHMPGPAHNFQMRGDQLGYIPVEWWPCNMAAIQYATMCGIIVVEAGGNGQQNLCDDIYNQNPLPPNEPFPDWWRNPFRRDPIDTKAILVGAGAPPESIHNAQIPDRSRLMFSNYGKVVDTQGWGDQVVTSGYGGFMTNDQDPDRWYTSRFWGTSSAAAMIAGALGCLQGVARDRGRILEPVEARELLRSDQFNSPQNDGPFGAPASNFRIGPRPDLCRLIEQLPSDREASETSGTYEDSAGC